MQERTDSGTQISCVSVLMLFLFCNKATGSQKQEYVCPVCMCPGALVFMFMHPCSCGQRVQGAKPAFITGRMSWWLMLSRLWHQEPGPGARSFSLEFSLVKAVEGFCISRSTRQTRLPVGLCGQSWLLWASGHQVDPVLISPGMKGAWSSPPGWLDRAPSCLQGRGRRDFGAHKGWKEN